MESGVVVEVDRGLCVMVGNRLVRPPTTFSNDDDGVVLLGDVAASTVDGLAAAGAIRLRRQS